MVESLRQTGQNPSASKPNPLHIVIFFPQHFNIKLRHIPQIPLERSIILLNEGLNLNHSLPNEKLAKWSTASCALTLAYQPSVSN
jgi:hypothetical protein